MRVLLALHHGLQAIGEMIGRLFRLALVLAIFFGSILALLMASFYLALGVGQLTYGGTWFVFLMFWGVVGMIGWYVSPHAQPQITKAMYALLEEVSDPGSTRSA